MRAFVASDSEPRWRKTPFLKMAFEFLQPLILKASAQPVGESQKITPAPRSLEIPLSLRTKVGPELIILIGLLTLLGYCVYQRLLSPLARYPGPFWASLTDAWFAIQHTRPDVHRRVIKLHEKYGPVVRVKPNKLSIASTDGFKVIYSAGNQFIKGEAYVPFKGKRNFDLFAERNERVHGQQRRLVGSAYTMETMKSLEPYVDATINMFLEKLEAAGSKAVELSYLVHLFAFDVIGEVSFAKRFGYVDAGSDFGLFTKIANTVKSGVWVGEIPWIYYLHQRLVPLIGNWLAINARNGSLHEFTLKQISARKDRMGTEDDHAGDILSKLLAATREKPQLSESDIGFTLTSNIIAGSDTTSVSLSATIYFLLKNPPALERLLRELREKVVSGEIDANGIVTQAQAEKWAYLQAVLHEGMRLHPALGGILARVVPKSGLRFGDHYVPEGVEVGTSPWVIHRDKSIFGDDVETFRPERWLDEKRKHELHRFFFGFGGGSRTCVGKNISMLEMNKVLPTLFLRFDLRLADIEQRPQEVFHSNVVALKPIHVVARKRSILEWSPSLL